MMQLSECGPILESVHRDGAFGAVGFLAHHRADLLTFLADQRYLNELLAHPSVSAVITTPALATRIPPSLGVAVEENPRRAFFALHHHLASTTDFYGAQTPTVIAPSAEIHPTAFVAERNVHIGERVRLEPHVTLMGRVVVEDDVVLRAGTVVGSEGFQCERDGARLQSVIHTGGVLLERGVEVQANGTIARGLFGGMTTLGADTKLDGRVFIGHDARLGRRNRVAAGAVFSGSVETGDDVWVGPGAVISHALRIGDGASVSLGAVVTRPVDGGQTVTGNLAIDHAAHLRFLRSVR